MSYALWKAERKNPTPEARRMDRPSDPMLCLGYWRKVGARTKADTPIALWAPTASDWAEWGIEPDDRVLFQFGAQRPFTKIDDGGQKRIDDFFSSDWLKCIAVTADDWNKALEAGQWADGKPIRMPTVAEQADIIPTTSAAEGGNADGNLVDQVKATLERGAEAIKSIGAITTLEKANLAAAAVESMRAAGKIGEAARKAEKQPHDDAAAAVQAKWVPVLKPGSLVIEQAVAAIQKFRDAEERRLREEERQRREAEEKRIREEEEARLRAEAEARALTAAQMGMEVETVSDEEIAEQAAEAAAAQVQQMPEANTTVRVGTSTGRGVAKAKVTKGRITDVDAFFGAIKEHQQTKDFLQTVADRLARNGVPVAGLEPYKE